MRSVGLNGKAFIPLLIRLCVRGAGHHGDAHYREQARPHRDDSRRPIHDLFGPPADLHLADCRLYSGAPGRRGISWIARLRHAFALCAGFLAAITTAKLLKSSVLKSTAAPFVLELPAFRWPTWQSIGLRLFDRGRVFLRQAGTIILAVSLLVWVLTNLPLHNGSVPQLEHSAIAHLGHAIEPLIRPLGFNWKIGVGLLTSVIAREVMVGTLGTIYGTDPATHAMTLQNALRQDLSLAGAMALLVFFAFAMQCTSTLAIVRRETNSWKWPAIQFAYMTVVAYAAAFAVNQVLSALLK